MEKLNRVQINKDQTEADLVSSRWDKPNCQCSKLHCLERLKSGYQIYSLS